MFIECYLTADLLRINAHARIAFGERRSIAVALSQVLIRLCYLFRASFLQSSFTLIETIRGVRTFLVVTMEMGPGQFVLAVATICCLLSVVSKGQESDTAASLPSLQPNDFHFRSEYG